VGDHRWQELTEDECRRLLSERHLGRLALVDAADERDRTGWSVVVRGRAAEVSDSADLERLRALPLYPWAPGAKAHYVRIRPASVTGWRIALPADLPFTWWG
jgi:nitroimidazol reductase NimA-like FMN-containing flavoprotein (pyridoxamine 5'-phosphate oxidase superfamily)